MKKFIQFISALFMAILIITTSIIISLNIKTAYYLNIDKIHAENPVYEKETMKENYDILVKYLQPTSKNKLELKNIPMSANGKFHFYEVKVIFNYIYLAFLVSLVISTILYFYNRKHRIFKYLKISSFLTFLIPILLGIPFVVNFSKSFTLFHEILFSNDYWIFDPKIDPVINILPEWFFMQMAFLILIIMFIFALTFFFLGKFLDDKYDDFELLL